MHKKAQVDQTKKRISADAVVPDYGRVHVKKPVKITSGLEK